MPVRLLPVPLLKTSEKFEKFLHIGRDIILQAVFPSKCLVCGRFLPVGGRQSHSEPLFQTESENSNERLRSVFSSEMAPFLCAGCRIAFIPVEPPFCIRCGMVFKSREGENRFCGDCIGETRNRYIGTIRSVGLYETIFMTLIRSFKYQGKIQLAPHFGRLLLLVMKQNRCAFKPDLVIPVPLHGKRSRERGFNQSHLMIHGWPAVFLVADDVLIRKKQTLPQAGLSRSQREENIKDAFEVVSPEKIDGKRIVLVDDVTTTGATLNECARVLLNAGAVQVGGLTLARR